MSQPSTQALPCAISLYGRRHAFLVAALALTSITHGQTLFYEPFTGGVSTTGFTIEQNPGGTCTWSYANPGAEDINGEGFDADFAIFDSYACGYPSFETSAADLVSPQFDASVPGVLILLFDMQYQDMGTTSASAEVWNGSTWNTVYSPVGSDVGYPNPAIHQSFNITAAAGGSPTAQVRFHFSGFNSYWWAIDNVYVQRVNCTAPENIAVTDITSDGGTATWLDIGSEGYAWVVTDGAYPDGSNTLASGDAASTAITGLLPGTYSLWVRSDCGGGQFSPWSGTPFMLLSVGLPELAPYIALSVHPNPATTELYITGMDHYGPMHASVFDVLGHQVMDEELTDRLSVEELASGTYVLQATNENGLLLARLVFVKH